LRSVERGGVTMSVCKRPSGACQFRQLPAVENYAC
jgi:hypothetical protein